MSTDDDDLLPQFALEARALLAEASAELLALEQNPQDAACINRLFRGLHTLKGSSGLFTLPPLTRLLHATEDVFQAMREGKMTLTPQATDQLFGALDEAAAWVEALDNSGQLPPDSGAVATSRAAALRALLPGHTQARAMAAPVQASSTGLEIFAPAALAALAGQTLHLVSYTPAPDCFFKGEDPLHLMLSLPGLSALAVRPKQPWPALAGFSPYDCALSFHAISTAPADAMAGHLRYVSADIVINTVTLAAAGLDDLAREVLAQQIELLERAAPEAEVAGRLNSARQVARHVLGTDLPETETAAELAARLRAVLAPPPRDDISAPKLSAPAVATATPSASVARQTLRVDQDKIDLLMQLAGELIVAKNSLPFLARKAEQHYGQRDLAREVKEHYAVIDRITQSLQGAVMSVRMMPVGQVFQRFPRLVRDLARQLGKQVNLVITGEETEAEKNVIESLFDPLLHMVRNSLDHGIEPVELRRAAGKPETALLALRARQEGDQVIIEIEDDGRGIDPARIRAKAQERGLRSAAALEAMNDAAVLDLIFAPGFSTAERVSDLSGRGVGMDVVRSAVQAAGGHVELTSTLGQGARARLALPLSMAVTSVMTVTLGGRAFGVPMQAVLETVRLPHARLTAIRSATAFVLRGQVVPLYRLAELLGVTDAPDEDGLMAVLVVQIGAHPVGIGIGEFGEVIEVILKPMTGIMRGVPGYSGTALLGDGSVLPVLHLAALLA